MKKIIAALAIAGTATAAWAACTTHTMIVNGKTITCTTCCVGEGQFRSCTTTCN